jgi:hypothetical protein
MVDKGSATRALSFRQPYAEMISPMSNGESGDLPPTREDHRVPLAADAPQEIAYDGVVSR